MLLMGIIPGKNFTGCQSVRSRGHALRKADLDGMVGIHSTQSKQTYAIIDFSYV